MAILNDKKVLLLDMNSTFMFGEDRFSADEDFYQTYRTVGGTRLDAATVRTAIMDCYAGLSQDYVNPARFDSFPTLAEGFMQYSNVKDEDLAHLIDTFALHERGHVPPAYADKIESLARTYALGLVANIWAPRTYWTKELQRAGVLDKFKCIVWSSEEGCIKPAKRIFAKALSLMSCQVDEAAFIGDSLECDMQGAKSVGMMTIWIDKDRRQHAAVDHTIPDLLSLN